MKTRWYYPPKLGASLWDLIRSLQIDEIIGGMAWLMRPLTSLAQLIEIGLLYILSKHVSMLLVWKIGLALDKL